MSATTEILLEQIKKTEDAMNEARTAGDSVALVVLQKKYAALQAQFNASSFALNEGKGVLKG